MVFLFNDISLGRNIYIYEWRIRQPWCVIWTWHGIWINIYALAFVVRRLADKGVKLYEVRFINIG